MAKMKDVVIIKGKEESKLFKQLKQWQDKKENLATRDDVEKHLQKMKGAEIEDERKEVLTDQKRSKKVLSLYKYKEYKEPHGKVRYFTNEEMKERIMEKAKEIIKELRILAKASVKTKMEKICFALIHADVLCGLIKNGRFTNNDIADFLENLGMPEPVGNISSGMSSIFIIYGKNAACPHTGIKYDEKNFLSREVAERNKFSYRVEDPGLFKMTVHDMIEEINQYLRTKSFVLKQGKKTKPEIEDKDELEIEGKDDKDIPENTGELTIVNEKKTVEEEVKKIDLEDSKVQNPTKQKVTIKFHDLIITIEQVQE